MRLYYAYKRNRYKCIYNNYLLSTGYLGIIMKNENKVDEMVSIMSTLHQHLPMRQLSGSVAVPGSSDLETVDVELLHKTLLGGDQLTVARARGAQSQRENSVHPKGQLSGFIPVVEDWHAKLCLMEVCVEIATCTYEINLFII